MKPIVVIYHRADFDGIFCREIAKLFLGEAAEYIGWDYGDKVPEIGSDVIKIYMLDISVDGMMDDSRLTWIDHHKSAIEKFAKKPTQNGLRIDGVAACRLTWQWFQDGIAAQCMTKEEFVDRKVREPLAVRLAGEYDIWDKRDPRAELFQHGLRSRELSDNLWSLLMVLPDPVTDGKEGAGEIAVDALLAAGECLQYAKTHENAGIIKSYGFTRHFEGVTFLCCNHARFNSHLFTAGIKPEHDGLLGFNFDGAGMWRVSLYGVPGKPDIDLSVIAVKHGGGGHKQACGFKLTSTQLLTIIDPEHLPHNEH